VHQESATGGPACQGSRDETKGVPDPDRLSDVPLERELVATLLQCPGLLAETMLETALFHYVGHQRILEAARRATADRLLLAPQDAVREAMLAEDPLAPYAADVGSVFSVAPMSREEVPAALNRLHDLSQARESRSKLLATEPAPPEPCSDPTISLATVLATFDRWLYLPDETPLLALLGTVAANLLPGDPVWLMLVAPPGSGKTELLESLRAVTGVRAAATLTEAALLSGTPKKEHAKGAKGGLLHEIGERGIILCKDFGSVLSMHRDERSRVLAALREVYDGNWTRHVGTDGGRELSWSGCIGIVAGCPPTIDRHHAVTASLGERFILLRFGETPTEAHTLKALAHAGRERQMRKELAAAVATLFAGVSLAGGQTSISRDEESRLVSLAMLVSRCRSAVERDGYSREIELIPGTESPTRLAVTLQRLFDGLMTVGVKRGRAWGVVRRVALDSMPALRRSVLTAVLRLRGPITSEVATAIGYPTNTTRRALEDLAAYRVVERRTDGHGKADRWRVADEFAANIAAVPEMSGEAPTIHESSERSDTIPEMSEDESRSVPESSDRPREVESHSSSKTMNDFSGKVVREAGSSLASAADDA
jgi:hypothetical protein